ncbi:MAG: ABC transporter ATP-binding protein [Blastocatellia bacterium]
MRKRLSNNLALARFAGGLLISPWPPFWFFLVAIALAGAITPLIEIRAIAGLISALTSLSQDSTQQGDSSLTGSLRPFFFWVLLLVAARVANWTINMDSFQQYLATQLNERVRDRLDRRLFQKALSLRLELFESAPYYDLLRRAQRGLDETTVSYTLTQLQRLVSMVFGCLAILWAIGGAHPLIPLLLLSGSAIVIRQRIKGERDFIQTNYDQTPHQRKQEYWRSLLTGRAAAAEVRLFDLGRHIIQMWSGLTDRLLLDISARRGHNFRREVPVKAANILLYGVVSLSLIYRAANGALSAGALVALLYAAQDYLNKAGMIGWRLERFQRFIADLRYVREFLDLESEERSDGLPASETMQQAISFKSVSFTYPGSSRPAISSIELEIKPGERVALVGENGAGKTTIARLLLGLYKPTEGEITVEGTDLQNINPRSWRAKVAALPQNFGRYAFTARDNIGIGSIERINDSRSIEQAAQISSAASLITGLPNGYETLLGKEFAGGQELSVGEWQKVALARVYLRDAPIVILDEPASALDALTESDLYRQFLGLSHNKTVLLISHRLGAVRMADRIIFLHQGRIIQEGTHDELMAVQGPYRNLYQMQAQWYQDKRQPDLRGIGE